MSPGQKSQFLTPIELIPNGHKLANQEVTFSCWLRSAAGTIPDGNVTLIKESAVYPSVGAITTTWTKFTHTWTVWNSNQPYMWIGFECPATYALLGGIDIAHCQLELGDTATPFEHKTYGQELQACERYYQTFGQGMLGWGVGTTWVDTFFQYRTTMRTSPTAILLDTTPVYQELGIANRTGSGSTIVTSDNRVDGTALVRIDGFTGINANKVHVAYNYGNLVIGMDAEL
jgi:hypothetical protein